MAFRELSVILSLLFYCCVCHLTRQLPGKSKTKIIKLADISLNFKNYDVQNTIKFVQTSWATWTAFPVIAAFSCGGGVVTFWWTWTNRLKLQLLFTFIWLLRRISFIVKSPLQTTRAIDILKKFREKSTKIELYSSRRIEPSSLHGVICHWWVQI